VKKKWRPIEGRGRGQRSLRKTGLPRSLHCKKQGIKGNTLRGGKKAGKGRRSVNAGKISKSRDKTNHASMRRLTIKETYTNRDGKGWDGLDKVGGGGKGGNEGG